MSFPLLTGVVACGGKSSRMGRDKCLLEYHGMPQYSYVAGLLEPLCKEVIISRSSGQESLPGRWPLLTDDDGYAGHGPLSAVLTAFARYPESALLVAGCDYPFLTADVFARLVTARRAGTMAVCFAHPESRLPEPLLALYEPAAAGVLRHNLRSGDDSLRRFLQNNPITLLSPGDGRSLESVDSMEAYARTLRTLGKK
jgi:molybdopterin-guanine dinucleotide biosynthesis protein A